eukprot:12661209-Alexandrium_andersonii.AAC.1
MCIRDRHSALDCCVFGALASGQDLPEAAPDRLESIAVPLLFDAARRPAEGGVEGEAAGSLWGTSRAAPS